MRLLIGIPTTDFVHVDFMRCLVDLILRLKRDGIDFAVHIESGSLVYLARDRIACKAINEGFTDVLWLDSDMIFNTNLLEELQFSGHDFISGIAHSRRAPYSGCLFKDLDLKNLGRWNADEYPGEPFEVQGCGFACVLIKTDILKAVQLHDKTCFTPLPGYGEDLSFCRRATALGFHIWAEPCARLGHISHTAIYPEDQLRYLTTISNIKDLGDTK